MHLAPELIHHSAAGFREPIIDPGKERENGAGRNDVMEMRDDVIGVVQIEISRIKRQRNTGQAADAEHREKGSGKEHRHVKSNRAAPEGNEKCAQNDDRRDRNDEGGGLEKRAHGRAHPGKPHVMGPDDEGKETEDQRRKDERFVTPERLARIISEDFSDDAHAGQNEHIHFRVTEKPKQMLPQERAAAAADVHGRSIHHHAGRHEKAGRGKAIHYLHDDRRFQWRERQHQKECGDKLGPDEKWQTHPGQSGRAQLNNGADEIDRSQQGGGDKENKANQPEGLAVKEGIKIRPAIGDNSKGSVRSPASLGRAAGHKKAYQHDDAADKKRLVTGCVHFREGHIGRADLQRDHKISKSGESQRNDTEKDHDRAVHGTE